MKKPHLNDHGTIFLTTMLCMFFMAMIGGYLFKMTSDDMFSIQRLKHSAQAQQLAEAGLADALGVMNTDWDARLVAGNFPSTSLGPGTYDASVAQVSSRWLVTSVGTVNSVSRTASCEVTGPVTSALAYILAGGSNIDIKLTAFSTNTIIGNIYATSNIAFDAQANNAVVSTSNPGNVYAGGTIDKKGTVLIGGSENPNWSNMVGFPVFDYAYYQNIAQSNCPAPPCSSATDYYFDTDTTFDGTNPLPAAPDGGVVFVNGDVVVSSTQTMTGCLVATGTIDIAQVHLTINQYNNFPAMLTQTGDILVRSVGNAAQGWLTATGLVYSGNNFSLSGNHNPRVDVTGSIVARGTLSQSGTQSTLLMNYVLQNPPGMISSGAQDMEVVSYNR